MKRSILYTSLSVLAVSLMVGCGGGSGESGPTAKLTDANIKKLGASAAKALPGCVYTDDSRISFSDVDLTMLSDAVVELKAKEVFGKMPVRQDRPVSGVEAGSCGGTLRWSGTHDNGNDDLTYTFADYCTGTAGADHTIMNGRSSVVKKGTPSPSGPVLDSITVSTLGDGISAVTTEGGVTKRSTLSVKNFKWTKDGTIAIDNLKSETPDGAYSASAISVEYNDEDDTFRVKSATCSDPEVGSVTVSTGLMSTDSSKNSSVVITVKGSEGEAMFTPDPGNPKMFLAKNAEGAVLGAIDCSSIENPLE